MVTNAMTFVETVMTNRGDTDVVMTREKPLRPGASSNYGSTYALILSRLKTYALILGET